MKLDLRNTRYEIRNTRYETGDTKYEIRNTRYEIRDTKYEIRNTRYEIRDTKYEMDARYLKTIKSSPQYTNKTATTANSLPAESSTGTGISGRPECP